MMIGFDLIILVVIVGAIAYAFGWRPQSNQINPAQPREDPLEILKARYVRGEITQEEYEHVRQDLES